jgi:hypothetical protein
VDCSKTCPDGGSYDAEFGNCVCTGDPVTVADACDTTCETSRAKSYWNSATSQFCTDFPGSASVCKSESDLGVRFRGGNSSNRKLAFL